MREIRFRGKSLANISSIKEGDWVYGGITYDCDRVWIDVTYFGQIIVDKDTVGQYTGLHDKNGKEIYEGDIVKVLGGCYEQGFYEINETNVIEDFVKDTYELMMICSQLGENSIEVIGNIWENKELLEG